MNNNAQGTASRVWLAVITIVFIFGIIFPGPIVASLAFTTVFFMVVSSIIAAWTCHDKRQAYWFGFAVVAGPYFVFALLSSYCWALAYDVGAVETRAPHANFFTSYLLAWSHMFWDRGFPAIEMVQLASVSHIPSTMDTTKYHTLMTTGHSMFTVIFGICGGKLGTWLARRQSESGSS